MEYQPDNSALSPDIIVSGAQLIPNADGSFRAPYPAVATSFDAFSEAGSSTPVNLFLATKPSGTQRLFLGTTKRLYEGSGTTWTDRSAGSTAYATGSRWSFCQYESQTLAANKQNVIQTSGAAAFAAVANAPKAKCIDTLNDALWAWNVDDGTDRPDELFITDQGDITDWTPDVNGSNPGSLAFKTRLSECPGAGTAMLRYRDFMVMWKRRGMWIGQYTGDERIYDVSLYSANVGCMGQDACLVAEDTLYFVDDNGVWAFDGASLRNISDPYHSKTISQSLLNAGTYNPDQIEVHYDDVNKVLSIYGPRSAGTEYRSMFWPYNTVSGKWGPQVDTQYVNGANTEFNYCMLRAPFVNVVGFSALGVTATANENRVGMYNTQVPASRIRNGHNSDAAGAAVTAFFGSAFGSSTLRRVFMVADSNTGVTVADATKRSPRSSGTVEGSASAAAFNSDMLADLMCDGNFHKLTWAWNAQTHASPADFRKWQGFEMDLFKTGRR
jgi:hypothetical protein